MSFLKKNNHRNKKNFLKIDENKMFENFLNFSKKRTKNTIGIQFSSSLLNSIPEKTRETIIGALDDISTFTGQEISLLLFSQDLYFSYMVEKSLLLKKYIEMADEYSQKIDEEIDAIEHSMYQNKKVTYN